MSCFAAFPVHCKGRVSPVVSDVVKKETGFILLGAVILSVIMELVFLFLGFWDYTVLLGNILSTAVCTLSFFLMGLTVQKAVGLG